MTTTTRTPLYASPADHTRYGYYGPGRLHLSPGWDRPLYPFRGRITADGSSGFRAEPHRYHLYAAWVCPYAHRAAIVRKLAGLEEVVSLSYVDDERDGRGWAFRQRRGHDPVNGFTLLEQAYEATEKGYGGHISVPVLWDRLTGVIVSNNFPDITLDLATQFGRWATSDLDLYPEALRPEINKLNAWIYHDINTGVTRVGRAATEDERERERHRVVAALERLDERLAEQRYLAGDTVTEADVRLWVTLARFDATYNRGHLISERELRDFEHLWPYARDLYRLPAFRETTEGLPADWDLPHGRDR
ncbi:Glutathione S-transferase, omega [[Actinomadura] parvosata subsp. kistnae]|uniref:Glutathione S-transferase n=1 Tax=[Actinomadura] parvosata subsp. kistnae TaxID=1909395 RepID=A0A1U9ZVM4_9ACTN|nr:glutathione S-transferase C-terminal domain-containing protein [Nonomuraea sp. ATCC 55076]AQZ61987.1 glutathione S-transferase [Nonomuraea sp. ATCC 55076]SPL99845.1 Glutathione S-transferase, omega [Actinomadura parvosata subsp. kistnae]